mgnify:CR=1 FL=1|tara:strand:+ start:476 stop:733 length:258 start_codon:yes stop_codon:yes gene_type:complete
MVTKILEEIRSNKTTLALVFAFLSLVYTYIEVRSTKEINRTIIGIYLRNFTFSFIIVYLALLSFKGEVKSVARSSQNILTGRPNF